MPQAIALVVGDGSLATLRGKLDDVRALLRESPAGPEQLMAARTERGDFGGRPLVTADLLSEQCARVEREVTDLAGLLGDAIEAMEIQVRVAEHGYEAVDEESLARLREIGQRLDAALVAPEDAGRGGGDRPVPPDGAATDPYAPAPGPDGAAPEGNAPPHVPHGVPPGPDAPPHTPRGVPPQPDDPPHVPRGVPPHP